MNRFWAPFGLIAILFSGLCPATAASSDATVASATFADGGGLMGGSDYLLNGVIGGGLASGSAAGGGIVLYHGHLGQVIAPPVVPEPTSDFVAEVIVGRKVLENLNLRKRDEADANGDERLDSADIVTLVNQGR